MKNRNYVLYLAVLLLFVVSCTPKSERALAFQKDGMRYFYASDNRAAIEAFSKAILLNPSDYNSYYYRGCCRFNLRQIKEATDDLNNAILLKPDFADAFATRGEVRFFTGDRDGACADWRRADELGKSISDKTKFCK